MSKVIDLTNTSFGDLTVVARAENDAYKRTRWICVCKCGNITTVSGQSLRIGETTSCGCRRVKHGSCRSRLYKEWSSMKDRCRGYTPRDKRNYKDRGITFCDEWIEFEPFRDWALANGYRDDLTLDRIDVNGNYGPSNCRWVTQKEQQNNKRNNNIISFNGKSQTLTQWARELGIKPKTLSQRINGMHWSIEKALTTPVK